MAKKRLYILRHGDAEPYNFENDTARKLTKKGIKEVQATAKKIQQYNEPIDRIFVSPYRRAQETADHFLAELTSLDVTEKGLRETLDIITPSGNPMDIALWLSQQESDSILLITHQPFASQLIDLLSDEALPHDFVMDTGTLVALDGDFFATACCHLRWIIHAEET